MFVSLAALALVAGQSTPAPKPPEDTPEEIAADAARDLKDSRFYNRPGATRADYDAAWQACRLIARGSRTPSGSVPMFYNPAMISPVAAGLAGGIGGLIGGAIAQGQQRRENRRECLMARGWRLVEVSDAEAARVGTMSDADRSAYFNGIVGAAEVQGKTTVWHNGFAEPVPYGLRKPVAIAAPGGLVTGKKVDPKVPVTLEPGAAAILIGFRRPDDESAGKSASVAIARYDAAGSDLAYRPRDWKKTGDKTSYGLTVKSADKKLPLEYHLIRVTPGDYVVAGAAPGAVAITNSFCLGAPRFSVAAGEVAYLGEFVPYTMTAMPGGERGPAMAWSRNEGDARATLAALQPALVPAMKAAPLTNGATYACSAMEMTMYRVPDGTDTAAR